MYWVFVWVMWLQKQDTKDPALWSETIKISKYPNVI